MHGVGGLVSTNFAGQVLSMQIRYSPMKDPTSLTGRPGRWPGAWLAEQYR